MYGDDDIVLNVYFLREVSRIVSYQSQYGGQVFPVPLVGRLATTPLILGSVYRDPRVERAGKNAVTEREYG